MALGLYGNNKQLAHAIVEAMQAIEPMGGQIAWPGSELVDPIPYSEGRFALRSKITVVQQSGVGVFPGSGHALAMPPLIRLMRRHDRSGTPGVGTYTHLRYKTTEWYWPSKITPLANSTQYDTASQTIYLPETAERVITSARLEVFYRTEFTATNTINTLSTAIQIGAGPTIFNNPSLGLVTAQSTANRNITDTIHFAIPLSYANQWITGTSVACVASFNHVATNASNVNGITFKLVLTYGFDPRAHTTRIKTIRIPIQSQSATLTNSQQEIGTDGVNPAPANQIPALDTFLPEASKTYRQIMLVSRSNDSLTTATTADTPYVQIDATSEVARATIDRTIGTGGYWQDHYDLTGVITTNAAHAVSWRSDVTARMNTLGCELVVTYEYNHSTSTSAIYEAIVPLTQAPGDDFIVNDLQQVARINTTNIQDKERIFAVLDIQEPGPIVMVQSAVMVTLRSVSVAIAADGVRAGNQELRLYGSGATVGEQPIVHRVDVGSGAWSLARGVNTLTFDWGLIGQSSLRYNWVHPYAIINYTAGIPTTYGGVDDGNHPVNYCQHASDNTATAPGTDEASENDGNVHQVHLGKPYRLTAVMLASDVRSASMGNDLHRLSLAQKAGEFNDAGGWCVTSKTGGSNPIAGTAHAKQSILEFFNPDNLHTGRLSIIALRRQAMTNDGTAFAGNWSYWITYHSQTFTVASTVTVAGSLVGAGKTVQIYKRLTSGEAELVTSVLTDASGAFTAEVPQDPTIVTFFASYLNDGLAGRSLDSV